MAGCPVVSSAVRDRLLVAAIDFGTTFSGYAFSFSYEFASDPLKMCANQWSVGTRSTVSLKAPSTVLFTPDREFHSFGYDAEDHYAELVMDEEHRDWFFFKHFKMMLYESRGLKRDALMKDDKGLTMPAMDVFAAAIGYLRRHMVLSCEGRHSGLSTEKEIYWVLTVPAIWDDSAKQFMREAAVKGGIDSDHLSLALEPEAAAIFCKHLPVQRITGSSGPSITCFRPGSRYLVLDAGGGTVDITVHEVQSDGNMRELYKANGGPWGGTTIDKAFRNFLSDILGPKCLEMFEQKFKDDYIDLFREFEIKKRTIGPGLRQKVTFKVPITLHECFRDINNHEFKDSVDLKRELKQKLTVAGDKIRMESEALRGLFEETCTAIVSHLQGVFQQASVRGTDTILMVGGFSESPMLQEAIRQSFPDKRVIIPNECGLAVLKGAVLFGHNPGTITARVCRYTYGVDTYRDFKTGKDPQRLFTVVEGRSQCKDVFSRHVRAEQQVEIGEEFESKTYYPLTRDQRRVQFDVFTSNKEKPKYTDEEGCSRLGDLTLRFQDLNLGYDRPVVVKMRYGETELAVEAVEVNTGHKVPASFDFLG